MFTWNRIVATIIFAITTTCLVITTIMTKQSGVTSAATGSGQELLGWAGIAIHLGLPAFGIASGIATAKGHKSLAFGCILLVVLCGLFSLRNVTNFVATERFSIAQQRDAENKIKLAREQAALDAVKEKQKTINKMAEANLKWLQGTSKEAEGRKERKDSMDSSTKFITEFSKAEIPTVQAPIDTTVTVRPDLGNQMIAEYTGWSLSALQLSDVVQVVLMLLIIEIVGWPLGSQLWALTPAHAAQGHLPSPPPIPIDGGKQRLLPGPRSDPRIVTVRMEPSAEWRQLLDEIDYPPNGSRHKGPERPRIDPDKQALRFLCWSAAYNERGEISADELEVLYSDFLNADHRELTASRQVKGELESIKRGKFASKRQVPGRGTLWTLDPPPLDVMRQLLERGKVITPTVPTSEPDPEAPKQEAAGEKTAGSIIPFLWKGRQAGGLH